MTEKSSAAYELSKFNTTLDVDPNLLPRWGQGLLIVRITNPKSHPREFQQSVSSTCDRTVRVTVIVRREVRCQVTKMKRTRRDVVSKYARHNEDTTPSDDDDDNGSDEGEQEPSAQLNNEQIDLTADQLFQNQADIEVEEIDESKVGHRAHVRPRYMVRTVNWCN